MKYCSRLLRGSDCSNCLSNDHVAHLSGTESLIRCIVCLLAWCQASCQPKFEFLDETHFKLRQLIAQTALSAVELILQYDNISGSRQCRPE